MEKGHEESTEMKFLVLISPLNPISVKYEAQQVIKSVNSSSNTTITLRWWHEHRMLTVQAVGWDLDGLLLKDSATLTASHLTVKSVDTEIKLAILKKLLREL